MKKIDEYILDMIENKYEPSVIKYHLGSVKQLLSNEKKMYFEFLCNPSFKQLVINNVIKLSTDYDIKNVYAFFFIPENRSRRLYTEAKYFTLEDDNLDIFAFVLENKIIIVRDLNEIPTDYYKRFYNTKDDVYSDHIFFDVIEFECKGQLEEFLLCKEIIKLNL